MMIFEYIIYMIISDAISAEEYSVVNTTNIYMILIFTTLDILHV